MRHVRCVAAIVCAGIAFLMTTSGDAEAPKGPAVLEVTGRLFGYYRLDVGGGVQLPGTNVFKKTDGSILLGMGDNFAPEFGASVQMPGTGNCHLADGPTKDPRAIAPEVYYKSELRLPLMAECDSVAYFLMKENYRAVVPGREDFIYSSTWLRRMALLLRGATGRSDGMPPTPGYLSAAPYWKTPGIGDFKTLMLAANVRVTMKADGPEVSANSAISKQTQSICPLFFQFDLLGAPQTCASGVDRTTVMDWLQRFDETLDSNIEASLTRQSIYDLALRKQLLANEATALNTALPNGIPGRPDVVPAEVGRALTTLAVETAYKETKGDPGKHVIATLQLGVPSDHDRRDKTVAAVKAAQPPPMFPEDALVLLENYKGDKCPQRINSVAFCYALTDLISKIERAIDSTKPAASALLEANARRAVIFLLLRKIAAEQKDVGYTLTGDGRGVPKTLIIGVVGQKTMQEISPVNRTLCTAYMLENRTAQTSDLMACSPLADPAWEKQRHLPGYARLVGTVSVGDPLIAASTIARAVWIDGGTHPDRIVVMAQMPHTEAEELGAHLLHDLTRINASMGGGPSIDVIVSEAQADHVTPNRDTDYRERSEIPVITPQPAFDTGTGQGRLVQPLSRVSIDAGHSLSVDHCNVLPRGADGCDLFDQGATTTRKLLVDALQLVTPPQAELNARYDACGGEWKCEDETVIQYLLHLGQRGSKADVVFAERRDFYLGVVPPGYEDPYAICSQLPQSAPPPMKMLTERKYCELRVALDRVLWKGDYAERVMTDGTTMRGMLTTALAQASNEQALAPDDTSQSWLVTFGIATKPDGRLVDAALGPDTFHVAQDPNCKDPGADATSTTPYCVNGQAISKDGAYWVATSDHIAEDTAIYTGLSGLTGAGYHDVRDGVYLTAAIADLFDIRAQNEVTAISVTNTPGSPTATSELALANLQTRQQHRLFFQWDAAKLVAGYNFKSPNASDLTVGQEFTGVAETRAQQPKSGTLDLEGMMRVTLGGNKLPLFNRFNFGGQADAEYERAYVGDISTGADAVTLGLNSFTTGPFMQYRIPFFGDTKPTGRILPRLLVVFAPFQYQMQLAANPLNYTEAGGAALPTVQAPIATSWLYRLGMRYEWGGGAKWWQLDGTSYAEFGGEYTYQQNVLSGLQVPGGVDCQASAAATLATCIKGQPLPATTVLVPLKTNLKAGGDYWDVHLTKALWSSRITTSVDSLGDAYFLPGISLPTQTRYAATLSPSVNFTVFGNFVLAPTYSVFFYRNQGASASDFTGSHSLNVRTFQITAKWYFARDAAVPIWRQLLFVGPASVSKTSTAKVQ
jgi:hypothetical protein